MKLHPYQIESIKHIIANPMSGLFLDMGLGKTVSVLTAIKKLMFEELDIERVLVIAPKRVAENVWTAELQKWPHLEGLKVSRIMGSPGQRLAALDVEADIYTLSRDNVSWLCGMFPSGLPFDMLVVDESSSFKSPKSLRFKALRKAAPGFKRIVLLTGTPAPNGLIDLWSQIYLLDRGERLGKFITRYREDYFAPGARNGAIVYNYKLRAGSEAKIHEKIEDICISMKSSDYLDLPGRINNYIDIPFSEDLQAQYDDFEEEQILELSEAGEITALNAAALSNKLLQFANGAVYDEDKNWHPVHDLKLEAAEEIVEGAMGRPVLIAWTYRHDMYRLMDKLKKYKPRELTAAKDINDWNSGKIQVLLMHPASGGHGLNLQTGGNIILWFGQTWSLELYQQLNARLDRQGQANVTVINHLVARGTVERDVVKALARKDRGQEGLMQAIKAKINAYVNR